MQPTYTWKAASLVLSFDDQVKVPPRIPAQGTSSGCGASMLTSCGVRMICVRLTPRRTTRPPSPSSPRPGKWLIHWSTPLPQRSMTCEWYWKLQPALKASSEPTKLSLSNSKRNSLNFQGSLGGSSLATAGDPERSSAAAIPAATSLQPVHFPHAALTGSQASQGPPRKWGIAYTTFGPRCCEDFHRFQPHADGALRRDASGNQTITAGTFATD